MSELVANCPRCGAKQITFNLLNQLRIKVHWDWQQWLEVFCICRSCVRSTVFILSQKDIPGKDAIQKGLQNYIGAVNHIMKIEGYISIKDTGSQQPPDHLPDNIDMAFREAATCFATGCYNASATMSRLCIDMATRAMLPDGEVNGLSSRTRRSLGLRLVWLFDNQELPEALRELSACIKDDGNDGAHEGTLSREDAADILDFTRVMLERIYTEPKRIELAKERRTARRESST